jgi:RNA polymerase sigma factor (sigma-70 family)
MLFNLLGTKLRMKESNNTRHTLLQKLQLSEGDEYWSEFVSSYEGYIYLVIRNMGVDPATCEDLLQDVLVKLWKSLSSFKYEKEKCRFRTWLCVIIRNTVYNYFQSKANRNKQQNVNYDEVAESIKMITQPEIDKIAEVEWKSFLSNKAWDSIKDDFSPKAVQVFEASLDEDDTKVLSERFGISTNVVRVYKSRIRSVLLKEITRLNFELGG